MRILLATEGVSDEVVALHLIRSVSSAATVEKKRMPARGFNMVRRSIGTFISAAHYGHFDALIVHFDLNNTLPAGFSTIAESKRWQDVTKRVEDQIARLKDAHRRKPLEVVLMAPCQSTEAWLGWGREGGNGRLWEGKHRGTLKRQLFGDPPRGITNKTSAMIPDLLTQLETNAEIPTSLSEFVATLRTCFAKLDAV